jgi:hypothetical protein
MTFLDAFILFLIITAGVFAGNKLTAKL